MQVRAPLPSELPSIRQLLSANGWAHRILDEAWFEHLVAHSRAVVAVDGARVVGFARGVTDGLSNGYLSMVVVSETHRGQGLGTRLVREIIGSENAITWLLRAERTGSREFFKRLGFSASSSAMERTRGQATPFRMHVQAATFRAGGPSDSVAIAALSVQVFLDTYATGGVRRDLAREAFNEYSEQAFLARLSDPSRRFLLAEAQTALVGFAEMECSPSSRAAELSGWELVRLYVQPRSQRRGVGSSLLRMVERMAFEGGARDLWLSVWEGNARARAFYSAMGYSEVGTTIHAIEGRKYGNKVVAKRLSAA